MDFSQERRGEVIEYLKDKYGHDNVFQVRTFNKMSDKGALKRAGQSLKVAPSVINKISTDLNVTISSGISKSDEKVYYKIGVKK